MNAGTGAGVRIASGAGSWTDAGVAVGADGLMVEVHPDPDRALSDGAQSMRPEQFEELMVQLQAIALAVGRTI